MDSLFITKNDFWAWFDRDSDSIPNQFNQDASSTRIPSNKSGSKKIRLDFDDKETTKLRILWGKHRPGKKHKVWEEDGYLTLVGRMAHVCDERGRLIEEPFVLDDIDYEVVNDLGELVIGDIEIQVQEKEK